MSVDKDMAIEIVSKAMDAKSKYITVYFMTDGQVNIDISSLDQDDTPLHFGERQDLERVYEDWVTKNELKDGSFNTITFLCANGLINADKARELIAENKSRVSAED